MARKITFFLLLSLLVCPIAQVQAQPHGGMSSSEGTAPKTHAAEKPSNNKTWFSNIKSWFSWCKRNEDSGTVAVDSLQILKDSIERLNAKIKQLESQSTPKLYQPRIQQSKIDSLQREIKHRDRIITESIVATFGHHLSNANADEFFCRVVMESPLFYRYNYERINFSVNMAKTMGYSGGGNKLNWIYNVYYDLLVNYNTYNQELKDNINSIIDQFDQFKTGSPNREFEKDRFEDRLSGSKYYAIRGIGEYGSNRHIFYLDFQIEQLRNLFKSNATFKKSNFERIRDAL